MPVNWCKVVAEVMPDLYKVSSRFRSSSCDMMVFWKFFIFTVNKISMATFKAESNRGYFVWP